MAEIEIIDQTLRDGQQSLWGMRMKVAHLAGIADDIEHAGYRVVDLTGSSIFECMMRYNREDPWDGLDLWRSWMPTSRLRSGSRSNCIAKFGLTPDSLMELWIRTLAKHGIDSFWIYDCLYNMDAMERLCRVVADAGCEVVAGDHVRDQPGAHRRMVRRPGPRVRELGHHRRRSTSRTRPAS